MSKDNKVSIRIPVDLWEQVKRDAACNHRSAIKQLELVLRNFYGEKK